MLHTEKPVWDIQLSLCGRYSLTSLGHTAKYIWIQQLYLCGTYNETSPGRTLYHVTVLAVDYGHRHGRMRLCCKKSIASSINYSTEAQGDAITRIYGIAFMCKRHMARSGRRYLVETYRYDITRHMQTCRISSQHINVSSPTYKHEENQAQAI